MDLFGVIVHLSSDIELRISIFAWEGRGICVFLLQTLVHLFF